LVSEFSDGASGQRLKVGSGINGIYQQGRLAAMIGERLGTDQTQEIIAICTHPDCRCSRGRVRWIRPSVRRSIPTSRG